MLEYSPSAGSFIKYCRTVAALDALGRRGCSDAA